MSTKTTRDIKLTLSELENCVLEVLKEGNYEIVNFPNLNNDILDYARFYEFVERLHKKLEVKCST